MPDFIKSVSLMSIGPARGHKDKDTGKPVFVDPTTFDQIMRELGKGLPLKVRADHGSGVMETIGWVDNPSRDAQRIRGDLHFYDNAPNVSLLMEIAEKNPTHLGLSLEFAGEDEETPDMMLARCGEGGLIAVALVSDPAANKSLFSALLPETKHLSANPMADEPKKDSADATLMAAEFSQLKSDYAALQAKVTALEAKQPADQVPTKMSDEDAQKVAEFASKETVKMLSAQFGNVWVPPAGEKKLEIPEEKDPVKKFEARVAGLLTEFKGNQVNARVAAMHRFSADYAATRPVAPKVKTV